MSNLDKINIKNIKQTLNINEIIELMKKCKLEDINAGPDSQYNLCYYMDNIPDYDEFKKNKDEALGKLETALASAKNFFDTAKTANDKTTATNLYNYINDMKTKYTNCAFINNNCTDDLYKSIFTLNKNPSQKKAEPVQTANKKIDCSEETRETKDICYYMKFFDKKTMTFDKDKAYDESSLLLARHNYYMAMAGVNNPSSKKDDKNYKALLINNLIMKDIYYRKLDPCLNKCSNISKKLIDYSEDAQYSSIFDIEMDKLISEKINNDNAKLFEQENCCVKANRQVCCNNKVASKVPCGTSESDLDKACRKAHMDILDSCISRGTPKSNCGEKEYFNDVDDNNSSSMNMTIIWIIIVILIIVVIVNFLF